MTALFSFISGIEKNLLIILESSSKNIRTSHPYFLNDFLSSLNIHYLQQKTQFSSLITKSELLIHAS